MVIVWSLTDGRGDATHGARPRDAAGHSSGLSCGCSLGSGRLLLHLPVALAQVKHLGGTRGDP